MMREKKQLVDINELIDNDAFQKIKDTIKVLGSFQENMYALQTSEDSPELNLVKIGTVLQLSLINILASGKKAKDLDDKDWESIIKNVSKYAVLEENQRYSGFVFSLYSDYIRISAKVMQGKIRDDELVQIQLISDDIRLKTEQLKHDEIGEAAYIEECLWLSLEAMLKLLSSAFTIGIPKEFASVIQSVPQFAFEYGRYALYSREQAILDRYLRNQSILDRELQEEYEAFMKEVQIQADRFQMLVKDAFASDIKNALQHSAALALHTGVVKEELLLTEDDVDSFFMD